VRRAWVLAGNDLLHVIKDRPSIFWMLIMPIGFIFIFSSFGAGSGNVVIGLNVIDEDRSLLSTTFIEALEREDFAVVELERAAAETLALGRSLRIPVGFQDSIAAGRQGPLYYFASEQMRASASMVAEMHVRRAIWKTLLDLARAAGGGGATAPEGDERPAPEGGDGLRFDDAFADRLGTIAAEPRQIVVVSETAGRGRPVPSGMAQSLPATVTLFMLINTTVFGAVFLAVEKQHGQLARVATYPVSRRTIFAGKLLGSLSLAVLQAAVLMGTGHFLLGAYLGNSLIGLAIVVVCFALVAASFALFWGAVLRRPEQATATTLISGLFLGAIGGCWWPLEVVPAWMRTAGHISPAAWAMDAFHALISFGFGIQAIILPCLVLLAYAALFGFLGARLMRLRA